MGSAGGCECMIPMQFALRRRMMMAGGGGAPAFVIPGDTPYNATPNTDGSYNLIL